MTPTISIILALVVAFGILVGIGIALVRKHRQRRIFRVPTVNRDQVAAERKAHLVALQKRASRQRHVH